MPDAVTLTTQHVFFGIGRTAYLWSSTESERGWVWLRLLDNGHQLIRHVDLHMVYGFSVRCVKD